MLLKAKEKIKSDKVQFQQADLTKPWNIKDNYADETFAWQKDINSVNVRKLH